MSATSPTSAQGPASSRESCCRTRSRSSRSSRRRRCARRSSRPCPTSRCSTAGPRRYRSPTHRSISSPSARRSTGSGPAPRWRRSRASSVPTGALVVANNEWRMDAAPWIAQVHKRAGIAAARAGAGQALAARARGLRALRLAVRGGAAARPGADAGRVHRPVAIAVARQRAAAGGARRVPRRAASRRRASWRRGRSSSRSGRAPSRRAGAGRRCRRCDPLAPLRRDVDLLASTLGSTIAEQEGAGLLESVERIRLLARAAREHSGAPAREALLQRGPRARRTRAGPRRARVLVLLPARQPRRAAPPHPPPAPRGGERGSATRPARRRRSPRSGPRESPRSSLRERASGVRLEPVLTAHPTEAARRTYLQSQLRLGRLLDALDDPRAAPDERRAAERAVAEETTVLWQTDEVRSIRPSVDDEIRQGLWFFEASLLDVTADLVARLDEELPGLDSLPLQFGTWIGGDQDGNPNATPDQIANALGRARTLALRRYRDEVRELARAIGVSDTLVDVDDELRASIARDERELPWVYDETAVRNRHEPYRRKLTAIWRRLDNELAGRDEPGYPRAAELAADLDLVDASLRHHVGARIADGRLAALRRRVAVFGLHIARLDVRVHAEQVRAPDDRLRATFAAVARGPGQARSRGARHGRAVRHRERRRRARDVCARRCRGLRHLGRTAVRDDRRPRRTPPGSSTSCCTRPRSRGGSTSARREMTVMVGLLGLGQGRRLPRGAVGDPRGARGTRRGRRCKRRRAHGLPRARRQHGARRRPDAPRDPRAAPAARRRAPSHHRAGRDDRVQVRPAGARAPQPRAGAGGDAARVVPGGREHHGARRRRRT